MDYRLDGDVHQLLVRALVGVVDLAQNTVHALESWDNRVTVTTPEDIGALTARICLAEPRIKNQVIYNAGDTVSYAQVADIVVSITGRAVQSVG